MSTRTTEYFNPREETMSQDELRNLQNIRLKEKVRYVFENNEYMRGLYRAAGVDVNSFRGAEEMKDLPMLSKKTFRDQFPTGLSCVDSSCFREMHMSSGSTGKPIVMVYTQADLDQWAECMARCWRMAGGYPGDSVQITPTFGLFNGGFGMYHGARMADMFVVPTSSGNTERQIQLINAFNTKILGAVISYVIRIIEVMNERGMKMPSLKAGVCGAETVTEGMKNKIMDALGIDVFNIYGMTETGGVGTLGMDCQDHSGIHVWEDHYYLEVIDPASGRLLPDGSYGELVVTSLTREAIPVIRYRTGDLTRILTREKCACGRTHLKIDAITGRTDDMLIYKGVNFFPSQLEEALLEVPGVLPQYLLYLDEQQDGTFEMTLHVEVEEGLSGRKIEKHIKERLGFSPNSVLLKPGELPHQEGKAKRIVKRKIS